MPSNKFPTATSVDFHRFVSSLHSSIASATDLHLFNECVKVLSICSIANVIDAHQNHRLCQGRHFFVRGRMTHAHVCISVSISTQQPTASYFCCTAFISKVSSVKATQLKQEIKQSDGTCRYQRVSSASVFLSSYQSLNTESLTPTQPFFNSIISSVRYKFYYTRTKSPTDSPVKQ